MTYEEFVSTYRSNRYGLTWRHVLRGLLLWYRRDIGTDRMRWFLPNVRMLLLKLRLWVPDGQGYYGWRHGRLCWPWRWYRVYYDRRFPECA